MLSLFVVNRLVLKTGVGHQICLVSIANLDSPRQHWHTISWNGLRVNNMVNIWWNQVVYLFLGCFTLKECGEARRNNTLGGPLYISIYIYIHQHRLSPSSWCRVMVRTGSRVWNSRVVVFERKGMNRINRPRWITERHTLGVWRQDLYLTCHHIETIASNSLHEIQTCI